ncbi:hypothetical protein WCLP8_1300003 [uncultured Gammaproteobacteria bacterium]
MAGIPGRLSQRLWLVPVQTPLRAVAQAGPAGTVDASRASCWRDGAGGLCRRHYFGHGRWCRSSSATICSLPAGDRPSSEQAVLEQAFEVVQTSFEKFCLVAGIEAMQELMEKEAAEICGERYQRHEGRKGRRWGTVKGQAEVDPDFRTGGEERVTLL